ncbi:hypothetical protein MASR2M15_21160 [Anaerolineales bacterium]
MTTATLRINRDIIIASKRGSLEKRKKKTPYEAVFALASMQRRPRPGLSAVLSEKRPLIIGSITRDNPYDPVTHAMEMVRAGVDAIAYFTDHDFYDHAIEDLLLVARGVPRTPVIMQNYILEAYDILSARAGDASAVMIHASILDSVNLRNTVTLSQRWKMSAFIQIDDIDQFDEVQTLAPHGICLGDPLSHNVDKSIALLNAVRHDLHPSTKIMLSQALDDLDQVERVLKYKVHALFVSSHILGNPALLAKFNQLLDHYER